MNKSSSKNVNGMTKNSFTSAAMQNTSESRKKDPWKNYGFVEDNRKYSSINDWTDIVQHDNIDMGSIRIEPKDGKWDVNSIIQCINNLTPKGWDYRIEKFASFALQVGKDEIVLMTPVYPVDKSGCEDYDPILYLSPRLAAMLNCRQTEQILSKKDCL